MLQKKILECDLCVIGGGMSGMSAAISAAREGISVVLMHDAYNKDTTLEAVPMIIEKLQAMNALILPITADTVPVHHNF